MLKLLYTSQKTEPPWSFQTHILLFTLLPHQFTCIFKTQIKSPRREHTILHRKPFKVQEFDHGGQAERLADPAPGVWGQGAHHASA